MKSAKEKFPIAARPAAGSSLALLATIPATKAPRSGVIPRKTQKPVTTNMKTTWNAIGC